MGQDAGIRWILRTAGCMAICHSAKQEFCCMLVQNQERYFGAKSHPKLFIKGCRALDSSRRLMVLQQMSLFHIHFWQLHGGQQQWDDFCKLRSLTNSIERVVSHNAYHLVRQLYAAAYI